MNLSASNDVRMIFQGTVEERNWKFPNFKTLLSLTCLHTNTLNFYSLLLIFVKITIQYGNYREISSWKENYGESMYVLRLLTKYSWWIRQLSLARIILHLWFKLVPAIGYLVNSGQLWFLCATIIDEQSASKTEKKNNHVNVLSQRGGVSQYTREAYGHKERTGHPQIAWNLGETVSIL